MFMALAIIGWSPVILNRPKWQSSPAIKRFSELMDRLPRGMLSIPICTLAILLAVPGYAFGIYPYLSKTFGGGKPAVINLVLKDAVSRAWPNGIATSPDGKSIGPVSLLLETSGFLVISAVEKFDWNAPIDSAPTAIEINKDLISLVVHGDTQTKPVSDNRP
jgi:hypothetical protein